MASTLEMYGSGGSLAGVIRGVRNRWRIRVALHGLTIVVGTALLALLVGTWVMKLFHFDSLAVISVRVITYVTLAVLAVRYMVLPLRRPTNDNRVALYLEEHEPSLDAVVLSAVEAGTSQVPAFARSPRFVDRLIEMAVMRATAIGNGSGIETKSIMVSLVTLVCMLAAGALIMVMGPEFMRTGAHLLVAPRVAPGRNVFIVVQPGDAKVSRNGDQAIRALLHGFDADQAELVTQRGTGKWERLPMSIARDSEAFTIRLFDLRERTTYYIEAGGVRSPIYHLDIVSLPYVKRMTLEYHYPTYTGLSTKTVDNRGDIAAPQGTSVIVRATTTMPVRGGRINIEGEPPIPMTLGADGALTATIPVNAPGFYKIELEASSGNILRGSLDYTIDVLNDNDPTVAFLKPGRDVSPTPIEDVFSQVEATDDYGVAALEIRYSVNGGPEQIVPLQTGASRKEIVAGYTFLLKSLDLKSGDVVSYYAQATDNDAIHGGKVVKTDIYFLNVRTPGDKNDKDDEKGKSQKGGKNGPQDPTPSQLLRKQRDIIVGTFKVDRDRARMSSEMRDENLATLSLAQSRLRQQVESLGQKIVDRGLAESDPVFGIIADELPKAAAEMNTAAKLFTEQGMRSALAPEQRALRHLQIADAAFQTLPKQQSRGSPQANQKQDPQDEQDMADMFNPPKDQMSQQYEANEQDPEKQDAAAIDELAEKIKQLAERQQMEREQKQQTNQQQSGDGGDSQRQLAKDVEQAAKQLAQLAREHPNDRQLRESARQLMEAANMMRQAAGQASQDQSAKALEKLQETRRLLAQSKQGNGKGDANQILDRAHDLVRDAESLADRMRQGEGQKSEQQLAQQSGQKSGQQGMQPGQKPGQQPGSQQAGGQQPGGQQPGGQQPGGQQPGGQQPGGQQPGGQQPGGQQPGGQQPGGQQAGGDIPSGGNGRGSGNPRSQLEHEYSQQRQAASALQRDLQAQGRDTKELENIESQMRQLEAPGKYQTPSAIQLANAVAQGLKDWEFGLRKQLGSASRPVLDGGGDVPTDFKALVSEYYKSLAKKVVQH